MSISPIPDCQFKIFQKDQTLLLRALGVLHLTNYDAFNTSVLRLLKEFRPETIYLDLAQLTGLDSAGMGVLVGLHMTARNRKMEFKILSPADYISKLFETTKLNAVFTILNGLDAEIIRNSIEAEADLIA